MVAVVRLPTYENAVPLARALLAGGVSIIEFTFTGANASRAVYAVREDLGASVTVGAGTILDLAEADGALAAGAQFIVTPAVRPEVIAHSAKHGVPAICGAFTATEVAEALDAGTQLIKIFPAHLGGPGHLRDLAAPFPNARFVPTGGITPESAAGYFAAGAAAVGMGTSLVDSQAVVRDDWAAVAVTARRAMAALEG